MHRPIPLAPPLMSTVLGSVTSLPVPVTPAILDSSISGRSQKQSRVDIGANSRIRDVTEVSCPILSDQHHHDGFMTNFRYDVEK
jgi:hypothetical protein